MESYRTLEARGRARCTRLYNIGAILNKRTGEGLRQLGCRRVRLGVVAVMLTILLVCAVVASLGVGVLMAYAICVGMFRVFRIHATQVAARRVVAVAGLRVVGN